MYTDKVKDTVKLIALLVFTVAFIPCTLFPFLIIVDRSISAETITAQECQYVCHSNVLSFNSHKGIVECTCKD